jgi:hypothetical protein
MRHQTQVQLHPAEQLAYAATGLVVSGFLLGGIGLTVGPDVLIWVGVALIVLTGAIGARTHVWTHHTQGVGEREAHGQDASADPAKDANGHVSR